MQVNMNWNLMSSIVIYKKHTIYCNQGCGMKWLPAKCKTSGSYLENKTLILKQRNIIFPRHNKYFFFYKMKGSNSSSFEVTCICIYNSFMKNLDLYSSSGQTSRESTMSTCLPCALQSWGWGWRWGWIIIIQTKVSKQQLLFSLQYI